MAEAEQIPVKSGSLLGPTPELGPVVTGYAAAKALEAAGHYVYLDCYWVGSVPATPKEPAKCKYNCGPQNLLVIRTSSSGRCLGEDGTAFKLPVWVEAAPAAAPAEGSP